MPSEGLITIQFCPSCGSQKFSLRGLNSWHCPKCDFTYFQNSAAAVTAILFHHNEILLTIRKADPGKGMLDLPGGFVDPGESLEEALHREIEEELKFSSQRWEYLFSFPNRYEYKGIVYRTTDAFFKIDLDKKPRLTACDDVADIVWMPVDEVDLNTLAFISMRTAIDHLRRSP